MAPVMTWALQHSTALGAPDRFPTSWLHAYPQPRGLGPSPAAQPTTQTPPSFHCRKERRT